MNARSSKVEVAPDAAHRRRLAWTASALLLASVWLLGACAETITKHGHQFQDSDLAQIQPGMSQQAVRSALGTPATTSPVANGNAFYYIGSTTSQSSSFFKPSEVDRRVVAVYFNPGGTVDRVAHYGLKDGRIFDFVKRQTPSHARDEGIVQMLFRNLGKKQLLGE